MDDLPWSSAKRGFVNEYMMEVHIYENRSGYQSRPCGLGHAWLGKKLITPHIHRHFELLLEANASFKFFI